MSRWPDYLTNMSLLRGWMDDYGDFLTRNRPTDEQRMQLATDTVVGFYGGMKVKGFSGGGGVIALGRFGKYLNDLKAFANKYGARILDKPFPKGVSLKRGLKAEIDSAEKIHFRMKGVKPGTISYDVELKYIRSKTSISNKTIYHYNE